MPDGALYTLTPRNENRSGAGCTRSSSTTLGYCFMASRLDERCNNRLLRCVALHGCKVGVPPVIAVARPPTMLRSAVVTPISPAQMASEDEKDQLGERNLVPHIGRSLPQAAIWGENLKLGEAPLMESSEWPPVRVELIDTKPITDMLPEITTARQVSRPTPARARTHHCMQAAPCFLEPAALLDCFWAPTVTDVHSKFRSIGSLDPILLQSWAVRMAALF